MHATQQVQGLRGRASRRLACQRGRLRLNFVAAEPPGTEDHAQRAGNPENVAEIGFSEMLAQMLLLSGKWTLDRAGGLLLLAMSVAIALLFLHSSGTSDVESWLGWMETLSSYGLVDGYQRINEDYPPLSHLFLFVVARLGEALGISHFLAVKTSILLFQLGATATMLAMSRSLWVAAAFNFGIMLNGVALGYLDVVFAPFLIGAFWAWRAGCSILGATLFIVAFLIKWQPIIIAPFVVLYLFDISGVASAQHALRSRLLRRLASLAAAAALFLSPFGLAPGRALYHAIRHLDLSGNAINLPWLERCGLDVLSSPSYFSFDQLDLWRVTSAITLLQKAIFIGTLSYVVYLFLQAKKSLDNLLLASIVGFVTYTTLSGAVHENHLASAVLLAFLLVAHEKRFGDGGTSYAAAVRIAVLLTAMLNINLFLFYGVTGEQVMPWALGISVALAPIFIAAWVSLLFHAKATLRVNRF